MTRDEAIQVLHTESVEISGNAVNISRFFEALDVAVAALQDVIDKDVGKKMTNADRIRNMTDKELANVVECPYGNPYFDEHLPCKGSCHDCILMWLQQPSEEN